MRRQKLEDKTIIALAAMVSLVVTLVTVVFCPGNNLDLKIALAVAIVAMVGTLTAYAYGVEKKERA